MSLKVIYSGGSWTIARDGGSTKILGGTTITYDQYMLLKDDPHLAGDHFTIDSNNNVVPIDQSSPVAHD